MTDLFISKALTAISDAMETKLRRLKLFWSDYSWILFYLWVF